MKAPCRGESCMCALAQHVRHLHATVGIYICKHAVKRVSLHGDYHQLWYDTAISVPVRRIGTLVTPR